MLLAKSDTQPTTEGRAAPDPARAVLSIKKLNVRFSTAGRAIHAVRDVDLSIREGETLALVGESGSGKSVTSLAIMDLLTKGRASVDAERMEFDGIDLMTMPDRDRRGLRGNRMAMIFQEPMTSLNPVYQVGWQIAEMMVTHQKLTWKQALAGAVDMLEMVGIPEPAERALAYPHQLSGGMRQRVMIAIALVCRPRLLIADEPTTALDVTIQAQILDLMAKLQRETGTSILFITHDLAVVAEIADRVAVMYAGQVVEEATVTDLFAGPRMPYSMGLMRSITFDPGQHRRLARLEAIPGNVPNPLALPRGCAFHPRCFYRVPSCASAQPALDPYGPDRKVRCLRWQDITREAAPEPVWATPKPPQVETVAPLLKLQDLKMHFPVGKSLPFAKKRMLKAIDGVSFDIAPGSVVGLVGESGSGKSTIGKMIVRMLTPTAGSIEFEGRDIARLSGAALKENRKRIQMIFQDPFGSLNPRMTVASVVGEGLAVHGLLSGSERAARVSDLLQKVGLSPEHAGRYPHEFSGGQRQRISIARCLAVEPAMIVADEPVSALDVSVQAQVLNLMQDLQQEFGLTMLMVSHDLGVVHHLADFVVVLYLGKVMEMGPPDVIYADPAHPYTRSLLEAMPAPDPAGRSMRRRNLLKGDIPSPINPPSGCVFRTRCPKAMPQCAAEIPQLRATGDGRSTACHLT
ncbi:MAG: dipeptide ABC transporter ATP-binding protein [Pseudorhodobacter sp.]